MVVNNNNRKNNNMTAVNSMDITQEILSEITVYNKYAKYIPELKRRESWEEIVERNIHAH